VGSERKGEAMSPYALIGLVILVAILSFFLGYNFDKWFFENKWN